MLPSSILNPIEFSTTEELQTILRNVKTMPKSYYNTKMLLAFLNFVTRTGAENERSAAPVRKITDDKLKALCQKIKDIYTSNPSGTSKTFILKTFDELQSSSHEITHLEEAKSIEEFNFLNYIEIYFDEEFFNHLGNMTTYASFTLDTKEVDPAFALLIYVKHMKELGVNDLANAEHCFKLGTDLLKFYHALEIATSYNDKRDNSNSLQAINGLTTIIRGVAGTLLGLKRHFNSINFSKEEREAVFRIWTQKTVVAVPKVNAAFDELCKTHEYKPAEYLTKEKAIQIFDVFFNFYTLSFTKIDLNETNIDYFLFLFDKLIELLLKMPLPILRDKIIPQKNALSVVMVKSLRFCVDQCALINKLDMINKVRPGDFITNRQSQIVAAQMTQQSLYRLWRFIASVWFVYENVVNDKLVVEIAINVLQGKFETDGKETYYRFDQTKPFDAIGGKIMELDQILKMWRAQPCPIDEKASKAIIEENKHTAAFIEQQQTIHDQILKAKENKTNEEANIESKAKETKVDNTPAVPKHTKSKPVRKKRYRKPKKNRKDSSKPPIQQMTPSSQPAENAELYDSDDSDVEADTIAQPAHNPSANSPQWQLYLAAAAALQQNDFKEANSKYQQGEKLAKSANDIITMRACILGSIESATREAARYVILTNKIEPEKLTAALELYQFAKRQAEEAILYFDKKPNDLHDAGKLKAIQDLHEGVKDYLTRAKGGLEKIQQILKDRREQCQTAHDISSDIARQKFAERKKNGAPVNYKTFGTKSKHAQIREQLREEISMCTQVINVTSKAVALIEPPLQFYKQLLAFEGLKLIQHDADQKATEKKPTISADLYQQRIAELSKTIRESKNLTFEDEPRSLTHDKGDSKADSAPKSESGRAPASNKLSDYFDNPKSLKRDQKSLQQLATAGNPVFSGASPKPPQPSKEGKRNTSQTSETAESSSAKKVTILKRPQQ